MRETFLQPLIPVREFARRELRLLVASMVVVLFLWAFLFIAGRVSAGSTQGYDERILTMLRSLDAAGTSRGLTWLTQTMIDISALGGGTVIVLTVLVVAGYLILRRQYHTLLFILIAAIGGGVIDEGLKQYYSRPRPSVVQHLLPVSSMSFPSGHSMMSAVVYLTLAALLARVQQERHVRMYLIGCALFLTFIIGFSRMYLGVHYPTDVLGGWALGLAWAVFCWLAATFVERQARWKAEGEGKHRAARSR